MSKRDKFVVSLRALIDAVAVRVGEGSSIAQVDIATSSTALLTIYDALAAERDQLRADVEQLHNERRVNALDGQAALDEANNEVVRLRARVGELERRLDHERKNAERATRLYYSRRGRELDAALEPRPLPTREEIAREASRLYYGMSNPIKGTLGPVWLKIADAVLARIALDATPAATCPSCNDEGYLDKPYCPDCAPPPEVASAEAREGAAVMHHACAGIYGNFERAFKHYYEDDGTKTDTCKACGLDLRNGVHCRLGESPSIVSMVRATQPAEAKVCPMCDNKNHGLSCEDKP